ncbi:sulfatase [Chitinophaga sp. MM2321]|uniref:sulfatase family protein n=1 Tax=Chitinophaga sp. MM2321 TaxID=3137178 RepID=UPI0032D569B6
MHKLLFLFFLMPALLADGQGKSGKPTSKNPNIIIVFTDDMGYGDLTCYGSEKNRTPNLDQMGKEGIRFTDFYVASSICTPSRSALMTGCYPRRVDMQANERPIGSVGRQVLFPESKKGLNPNEITIAEVLKRKGYTTACIGKWHLGDQRAFLPTRQGFDYYFGIPYSNDMGRAAIPLPLMRNEEVIEAPVDQNTITKRYTEEAVAFIKKNKNKPFFIYLPHAMPHTPVYASDQFRGKSANGIYGDAVEEIDWSMGEINRALKENGLDDNTLVIFTSDNGADKRYGGSNLPLSGYKGSTAEGGMRVPCLMRWPAVIPAGKVCNQLVTSLEIMPTLAKLVSFQLPKNLVVDGKDMLPLMRNPDTPSPRDVLYYYQLEQLQAIRSGTWKLIVPTDTALANVHQGKFGPGKKLALYDLGKDIKEEMDVSADHPDVVARLMKYAAQARNELGDLNVKGKGTRKPGMVENPVPQLLKSK